MQSRAWRLKCPEEVRCRQLQALYGPRMFLVREKGPLALVVREEGRSKPLVVQLGARHKCSCRASDLCVHICWALLKRFKLNPKDILSYQVGLVSREISGLLRGIPTRHGKLTRIPSRDDDPAGLVQTLLQEVRSNVTFEGHQGQCAVAPRVVSQNDTCAICLETLLDKHWPVTYCKFSCGNPVHIRCMEIWIQHHQNENKTEQHIIKCPICRGFFNLSEELRKEIRNAPRCSTRRWPTRQTLPKIISTTTDTQDLLQETMALLNGTKTIMHSESSSNSDISSQLSLIQQVATPTLVGVLPTWRVPPRHRLLVPGRQCCLCLKPYQAGEMVSGLPCTHEFHSSCLKPWMLRNSIPRCPLDASDLTPWLTERLLSMKKSCPNGPVSEISNPTTTAVSKLPEFKIASYKLTLKNRLLTHRTSSRCSINSVVKQVPPPRHLSDTTTRSSAPSVHLLTLELPTVEGLEIQPRPRTPSPHRSRSICSITPRHHVTVKDLHCFGLQVRLLKRNTVNT